MLPIEYRVISGRQDADIKSLAAISVLDNKNPEILAEAVEYFRSELEQMDTEKHLLIGAFAGHEITGFARFVLCERIGLWWCRGLVVNEQWRKRGIGTALLKTSLRQLQQRKIFEVRSDTSSGNIVSQATHLKAGFVLSSTEGCDFDGQRREDHHFYTWRSLSSETGFAAR